ncbi:DUF4190 domain-containing protein [Gordonia sp. CPCC 205515]|uniref:DUF4190 domain-containing protein n=1 Tax=Gordonia sp. CPCC 205515 TaxID=3140791 RepID=UPI003AF3CD3A
MTSDDSSSSPAAGDGPADGADDAAPTPQVAAPWERRPTAPVTSPGPVPSSPGPRTSPTGRDTAASINPGPPAGTSRPPQGPPFNSPSGSPSGSPQGPPQAPPPGSPRRSGPPAPGPSGPPMTRNGPPRQAPGPMPPGAGAPPHAPGGGSIPPWSTGSPENRQAGPRRTGPPPPGNRPPPPRGPAPGHGPGSGRTGPMTAGELARNAPRISGSGGPPPSAAPTRAGSAAAPLPPRPPAPPKTTDNGRPAPLLDKDDDFEPIVDTSSPDTGSADTTADRRPLAYSAATSDDAPEETLSSRTRAETTRPKSRAASSKSAPVPTTNRTAIWALVCSILGITAPIGLILGYRAKSTIARTRELGESYARVAIWIGWLYVAAFVLALIMYLWIAGQGS